MPASRTLAAIALTAAAAAAAGCGGGERQDADEPEGDFRLEVTDARFPVRQALAEAATLAISVRNSGDEALPDVAVTVETDAEDGGKAAMAFGRRGGDPSLADAGRPVWVVDRGPRRGTTAYTNTWSLGPLAAGATATFRWRLTAVRAGLYRLAYRVAPGLDGRARAAGDPESAGGSFSVTVADAPRQVRVTRDGRFRAE